MTIKRFVEQLKAKLSSKEFWKYFFAAVGTISSVVTLISFVFQLQNPECWVIVLYILGVVVFSIAFAIWQTWRKTALDLKVSNTLNVTVKEGDIFDCVGNENYVVIPVNEYFDTLVNETIINKSTVHGQFIQKYYKDNHEKLHEEIEASLKANDIRGKEDKRIGSEGYKKRYPLGTCAIIKKDNTNFVLLALTHFDNEDHAYVELSEFGRSISTMCKTLAGKSQDKPVYMPLMGMGLSRLNQTAQFILKYTLDSIYGIKGLALPGGLNIIVYPPVAKTLNLNEIKY